MIAGDAGAGPTPGSEEFLGMLADFGKVTTDMAKAGVLIDSAPLQDPSTATTVRVLDGKRLVVDGPFAEFREQLGGYYVLGCPDLDAAVDWGC